MELDKSDIREYIKSYNNRLLLFLVIFISSVIMDIFAVITFHNSQSLVVFLVNMSVSCLIKIIAYTLIRTINERVKYIRDGDYECVEGILQELREEFTGYNVKIQGMDSNIHARSIIGNVQEGETVKAIKFKNSKLYDIIK